MKSMDSDSDVDIDSDIENEKRGGRSDRGRREEDS